MIFEEFDSSILSDDELVLAFLQAYGSYAEGIDPCDAAEIITILVVSKMESSSSSSRQGMQVDRVVYQVLSGQVEPEGLFPTPATRIVFVEELNLIFSQQQLPLKALAIREVPAPTPRPTPPVAVPTTPSPSKRPTTKPSSAPSGSPSGSPSHSPTKTASSSPSARPTKSPSSSPSSSPSLFPSAPPSESPLPTLSIKLEECKGDCNTNFDCLPGLVCWQRDAGDPVAPGCPDLVDTTTRSDFCVDPEKIPSGYPSYNPTQLPSVTPSIQPSLVPTQSETLTSSNLPPLAGVPFPSVSPSSSTDTDSADASAAPSTPEGGELQEADLESAIMILSGGVEELPPRSKRVLIVAIQDAVEDEVDRILNPDSAQVTVTIVSQQVQQTAPRFLQEMDDNSTVSQLGDLTVVYVVNFLIEGALVDELDPLRYVGSAFDSQTDRDEFVATLKGSGDDNFQNLTSIESVLEVAIVTTPSEINGTPPPTTNDKEGSGIGIILASVGAGVAGISLIGLGAYMMRQRSRSEAPSSNQQAGLDFFSVNSDRLGGIVDGTTRYDLENEVSTLGDPIPQSAMAPPMEISLDDTAGQSLPYDYKMDVSRDLYSVDEGNHSQAGYSDMSSNVVDGVADFRTLDDTDPMDQPYLSDRGKN